MAYTVRNFKTKKELKLAVKKYMDANNVVSSSFAPVNCYNPGLGPDLSNYTGSITLEGPHYPKPHTWYAQGEMVNGVLVKVK